MIAHNCSFSYQFFQYLEFTILSMADLVSVYSGRATASKSLTNNIEHIVPELLREQYISSDDVSLLVFYRDSKGRWDRFIPGTGDFDLTGGSTFEEAITNYLERERPDLLTFDLNQTCDEQT